MKNVVHLIDCMEFMKTVPDKYYELAIVDPPYGIGADTGTGADNCGIVKKYNSMWDSETPKSIYFEELFRISKNRIIWGVNYYSCFDLSGGRIVWDKDNTGNFSDCEIAYSSFGYGVRKFRYRWNGMIQENMKHKEERIHPTQKPVALYKWLLTNYAKPNDKIFDSHVGSGSSRIACHDLGFDFEGCELDPDYWQGQEDRFKAHISQQSLFDTSEIQELIYK